MAVTVREDRMVVSDFLNRVKSRIEERVDVNPLDLSLDSTRALLHVTELDREILCFLASEAIAAVEDLCGILNEKASSGRKLEERETEFLSRWFWQMKNLRLYAVIKSSWIGDPLEVPLANRKEADRQS